MRHGCLLILLSVFAFPSYARVNISVDKFADKSNGSNCPGTTTSKADIGSNLQSQLVDTLMQFNRYKIQQREVRPVKHAHRLVGVIRTFQVCARSGAPGQDAKIELELTLLDGNGHMTHVFTSTVNASSGSQGIAGETAMSAAVGDLAHRIDGAIPSRRPTQVNLKAGRSVASNSHKSEYQLELVRRPSAAKAQARLVKRSKRVAGN